MSFDSAATIDLSTVGGRSFLSNWFLPSLLITLQQLCLLKKASILSPASQVCLWIHAWMRHSVWSASWPTSQCRSSSIRCWIRQWGGLWEQTNDAVQSRHKEMLRKDLQLLWMLQNKIEEVIKEMTEVLDTWDSHGMNSFLSQWCNFNWWWCLGHGSHILGNGGAF